MGRGNPRLKKLEAPYYPGGSNDVGHEWYVYTIEAKYIADYCNITISDVDELDLIEYLCYLRDARIYNLSMTEDGQKYLKNAWRIREVKPDREKLRDKHKTN